MSYVLNLQATQVAEDQPEISPQSLSLLSPVTCFSSTSVVLC
ncbi:hypothetical protein [Thermostaphylospora chromogena]|uniref:Uncharacterized protein n=1 Tax=Thermostaphylospora chromogena TaxID=35622 RepID=A0A1H1AA90_9ACTN|nr:hypothetical protein [Thermostaphylospora chromogena]SDQ36648.1 hypothetical protein SAMN04489764_0402 [Thermostaphylospora chromogena]